MIESIKKGLLNLFPTPNKALKEGLESLNRLESLDFSNLQDIRKATADWEVGETRNLNGTFNTLLYKGPDKIIFRTIMPPLSEFEMQWHLLHETCDMIAGLMADKTKTPLRIYTKGERVEFTPEHKHKPFNPSPAESNEMIVTFWDEEKPNKR